VKGDSRRQPAAREHVLAEHFDGMLVYRRAPIRSVNEVRGADDTDDVSDGAPGAVERALWSPYILDDDDLRPEEERNLARKVWYLP